MSSFHQPRRTEDTPPSPAERSDSCLICWGVLLWCGCLLLTFTSNRFAWGVPFRQRPLIEFVVGWGALFAIYLAALRTAVRRPTSEGLWRTILLFAIACRLVLVFSTPVQELDYYRYLWDGHTVLAGVSPYRYSPQQVLAASVSDALPQDLRRLVTLRETSPQAATIAGRVHYGDLPSIYPPVSLAVFAAAVASTPGSASVETSIVILKLWMVLFDLGTLLLLAQLLRHVGWPIGWTVAYAWCPLVLKEFANTGHLDAIAVCLTTAAVTLLVRATFPSVNAGSERKLVPIPPESSRIWNRSSAAALGLAIGAKLYPVILTPLVLLTVWRLQSRRRAVEYGFLLLGVTCASCAFMLTAGPPPGPPVTSDPPFTANDPPLPDEVQQLRVDHHGTALAPHETQRSLKVFLSEWKMNDFIFLILESNLSVASPPPDPWFAIVPASWRSAGMHGLAEILRQPVERCGYLLTRTLLSLAFLVLASWWAWTGSRAESAVAWLRVAFLTIAWFWVLQPTLNPWYWTWALPLLPFARRQAWTWVSGLLGIYYLRFWFGGQYEGRAVWGTPYLGEYFFHYVVVWFEHAPWLVWLTCESFFRRGRDLCVPSQTTLPRLPILPSSQLRVPDGTAEPDAAGVQFTAQRRPVHKCSTVPSSRSGRKRDEV